MTEQEWRAATEPMPILKFLRDRVSDRKMRLFAAACCRRVLAIALPDKGLRAVEVAERFADQKASLDEFVVMQREGEKVADRAMAANSYWKWPKRSLDCTAAALYCFLFVAPGTAPGEFVLRSYPICCASYAANLRADSRRGWFVAEQEVDRERQAEQQQQVGICYDLFANPFRAMSLSPCWTTPRVLGLAQAAYDARHHLSGLLDTQRLNVLADALEEVGCDNAELLDHLYAGGAHYRGCWAVDRLLGKA